MKVPNQYRVRKGALASSELDGNNGYFVIPFEGRELAIISSDGMGWDHVSVSLENRTPNWKEMCLVKNLFFDEQDCVVQFHPPKSEYVNNHPHCLHLWKSQTSDFPMPPSELVGYKDMNV